MNNKVKIRNGSLSVSKNIFESDYKPQPKSNQIQKRNQLMNQSKFQNSIYGG